jgi:hypothetical protein
VQHARYEKVTSDGCFHEIESKLPPHWPATAVGSRNCRTDR